ncbi:DUF5753 domain-containing protein [Actinosynnema sp. NPDC050436]|uniref:DUF5753 domain-containing protein n=1 Tax=Actinosynnema sp. NPDC050436 TaxID=3155659 RepID=UPI00340B5979
MVDPLISRLRCGELARQLRRAARLEPGRAESLLRDLRPGFYATKLSKIENGVIAPAPGDVEAMVTLYRPSAERTGAFRALAQDARRRARPGATVGARAKQYLALERLAVEIRMVYNEIPGLLQTREYAHALMTASPLVVTSKVDALAEERAERGRTVLRPDGPRVWVALGEDGLTRSSGGPATLRRQLEHLRETAHLPNVAFRVITRSAGNVAALGLPFTLLRLAGGKSIAFVANIARSDCVKSTAPFLTAFRNAWERATHEHESTAILDARIAELR